MSPSTLLRFPSDTSLFFTVDTRLAVDRRIAPILINPPPTTNIPISAPIPNAPTTPSTDTGPITPGTATTPAYTAAPENGFQLYPSFNGLDIYGNPDIRYTATEIDD